MRLLYVTNGITGAGGLERVLSVKTRALIDLYGYEIHVIVLNEKDKEPFYDFHPDLHIHNVEMRGGVIGKLSSYLKGIRSLVKSIDPDVVSVCDDGLKGFFLPVLAKMKDIPFIYERHISKLVQTKGNPPSLSQKVQFFLMDALAPRFDKVILLTEGTREEWNLPNIQIIPNPLSFFPDEEAALTNKQIIAVGTYSVQKGFDRLLDVWGKLLPSHPDWRLDIYGTERDNGALRRQVADNKFQDSVFLHAPSNGIMNAYLNSSIFAFPSRYEGFGMVLIEAMSCGVPCVSFDCPCGPADIIKDGEDGFLVPNGDIQGMADALSRLMDDEALRRSMGAAARQNAQRYDVDHVIPQWHELFTSLVKKA